MTVKSANAILLKLSTTTIDASTEQEIVWTIKTADATTKDSLGHDEFIAVADGGTLKIAGKYDSSDSQSYFELLVMARAKTSVAFVEGGQTAGDKTISGYCFVTNMTKTANLNGTVDWSADMLITGDITVGVAS